MATLPTLTQTIDDAFTHTWYEIRKDAIDNILDATVITAALRERGCFKAQVGGKMITRTIRYGEKSTQEIGKGSILSQGEDDIETMAWWYWKYFSSHIQRSMIDDQQNNGPTKIKDLVSTKISAARDALQQKTESVMFNPYSSTDDSISSKTIQGLNQLVPFEAYYDGGMYGNISKADNSWWRVNVDAFSDNSEVNLLSDMKSMFNTCTANIEMPNLIVCGKTKFELYEDFALDISQLIVKDTGHLANLGYRVLQFKGQDMVWVPDATIEDASSNDQMLFLNTNYIEFVYDPQMWYSMTNWKEIPLQTERIAHIICAGNMIGTQPRRQGRLYES
jgi:hypothetical protein